MNHPTDEKVTHINRDVFVGGLFVLFGLVWDAIVYATIPPGQGPGNVGPRAFPLYFGLAFTLLSLAVFIKAVVRRRAIGFEAASARRRFALCEEGQMNLSAVIVTGVLMLLYGYLLQKVGFIVSTAGIVALTMVLGAREKSVLKTAAMSVGITLACWLIFSKALGVYLPIGSWIQLG